MGREAPDIGASSRAEHLAWLLALAQVPTASGREHRVMTWVERWVQERDRLELTRDESGNMHVAIRGAAAAGVRPLYFTAHLDHPAFVVERIVAPTVIGAPIADRMAIVAPMATADRMAIVVRIGAPTGRAKAAAAERTSSFARIANMGRKRPIRPGPTN